MDFWVGGNHASPKRIKFIIVHGNVPTIIQFLHYHVYLHLKFWIHFFIAIFRNEITTILKPWTSEGGSEGSDVFLGLKSLITSIMETTLGMFKIMSLGINTMIPVILLAFESQSHRKNYRKAVWEYPLQCSQPLDHFERDVQNYSFNFGIIAKSQGAKSGLYSGCRSVRMPYFYKNAITLCMLRDLELSWDNRVGRFSMQWM